MCCEFLMYHLMFWKVWSIILFFWKVWCIIGCFERFDLHFILVKLLVFFPVSFCKFNELSYINAQFILTYILFFHTLVPSPCCLIFWSRKVHIGQSNVLLHILAQFTFVNLIGYHTLDPIYIGQSVVLPTFLNSSCWSIYCFITYSCLIHIGPFTVLLHVFAQFILVNLLFYLTFLGFG